VNFVRVLHSLTLNTLRTLGKLITLVTLSVLIIDGAKEPTLNTLVTLSILTNILPVYI